MERRRSHHATDRRNSAEKFLEAGDTFSPTNDDGIWGGKTKTDSVHFFTIC